MKRHHQLLFLLVFLASSHVPAQDPRLADSLRNLLTTNQVRDTAYFDVQYKLIASVLYADPGGEAMSLSRSAVEMADSLHDTLRLGKAHNILANCYKATELADRAMVHYLKAMAMFEVAGDQKWIANMHSNLSNMYMNKGDLSMAMKEQQQALTLRKRIGYYRGISGVYNGLGNIYDTEQKHDLALQHYQLAYDSCGPDCSPYDRAMYLGNLGNAYGELKHYDLSRKINFQALDLHRQMGLRADMSRDLQNIGESHFLQNHGDSALYYLLYAYRLADSVQNGTVMAVAANNLRAFYESTAQYHEALKWSEIAAAQRDSLNLQRLSIESNAQDVAYRVEQAEREAAYEKETTLLQKDADLKRQRILNWSMGLGLLLLGGFGFVVSKRYREKKQANAILEEKVAERTAALKESNAQLLAEVEQKERASKTLSTFIYRSSHDLKGPLTSIKGLVNVAKSDTGNVQYIDHIGAKVDQLDGVLQLLIDKLEVDSRVPARQPIDWPMLWQEVIAAATHREGFARVQFQTDFSKAAGFQADPVLLKIALRELVHNAIDFHGNAPVVKVTATVSPNGKAELSVEDGGPGIAADQQEKVWEMFYRGTNASKGAGLGLFLVREAAAKMGARTALQSPSMTAPRENSGPGTLVKLVWA